MFPTTRTRLSVSELENRSNPATLDLTTAGASATAGGALFVQDSTVRRMDDFVRLDTTGRQTTEAGHNLRGVRTNDVPIVTVGGTRYAEFVLDINQRSSSPLLSLDQLKVFVSNNSRAGGYNASTGKLGGQSAVYDLDAGGDNRVDLHARLSRGSSSSDMRLLVPESALAGGRYVYLYSQFGSAHAANGGYEEWGVRRGRGGCDDGGGDPPPTQLGTISGSVFYDANSSGARDAGEIGYTGVTVYLDANGNDLFDEGEVSTLTNDTGNYAFTNLATGAANGYNVRVADAPLPTQTTPNPGTIFLSPGQTFGNVDFGYVDQGDPT